MSDLVVEVKIKNSTKNGADEAKRAVKSIGDESEQAVKKTQSLAKLDFSEAVKKLNEVKNAVRGLDDNSIVNFSREIQKAMDVAANAGVDYLNILKKFKPELDELTADLKNGSISQEDYNRRLASLPPIMQRVIADSRKLGSEIKGVGEQAEEAATNFEQLTNAGDQIKNIGSSISGLGQQLMLSLTVPILGLAVLIGSLGIGYEQSLNIFQAVTRATAEEMKQASKVAKDLGADVDLPATSAKDAALAMAELGKAGLSAKESMDAARATLLLAAAGQLDEAKAAEITANALNAFSLKGADAARVADLLAAASNASSAEVSDVAESFSQASASFAAAKVPIEDLTTAIAIMANAGIKGSDAGTSLKTFLSSIQAPSDSGASSLDKLGIKVFDLQGRMKSLPDIIGQFEKSLSSLTDEEKVKHIDNIFGSDASRAAQILFRDGAAGFEKVKQAVTQTGAASDLAKAKTKGLGGAWEALKSQLETVGITIYEALKNPAEQAVRFLADGLGKVSDYLAQVGENNPQLIQLGAVFLGIVAAAAPLLIVVGGIVTAIGAVVAAISTIAGAITTVGLTPIIMSIAAVAIGVTVIFAEWIAIAAVLYEAWKANFGGIQEFTAIVAQTIKTKWTEAVEAVRQLTADVTAQISQFWAENGADIMRAVNTASANIKKTWQSIVAFWSANGETIKSYTAAAWGQIRTLITSAVSIIANTIKLIAAVINGDWSKAWQAAKAIFISIWSAIISLIKNGVSGLVSAVKLLFNGIWSLNNWVISQAIILGKNLVQGIISGIGSLGSAVWQKGKEIVSGILDSMRQTADIHSPSRITTMFGEFMGEGLAIGMENKFARVKAAAGKMAQTAINDLRDALLEFQKLAGASPETVSTIQKTDRVKEAVSSQQEIIKLRGQLNINQSLPLPTTGVGVESEISFLRQRAAEAEKYNKTLDDLRTSYNELQEVAANANDEFTKKIEAIQQNGSLEILKLREEVNLTGVIDERERRRIQNIFEILRLREQMANDGYGQQQIDEAAEALRIEQARASEWQRILDIRKQVAKASELEKDLTGRLSDLQNGNRELSEYEKTLKKINSELKDISPQQRENLLILAQQIDAQKAYNEAYEKTYDYIRGTFETLADSSKSIKEKLSDIFGGILNSFKKMLLDMAAAWLSSKLLKALNIGGNNGNSGGGFSWGNLLGGLLGGGNGGSGGGIFSGNQGGAIWNFGSSSSGSGSNGNIFHELIHASGQSQTEGGSSSGAGKGVGIAGAIGAGANIVGGLIGGRVGGIISNTGTGIAIGAQLGSIIPGIGTVAGAIIGGAIGFFSGLFGDKKKKIDKKENMPKLQDGFKEAFEQLRQLTSDRNAFYNDPDGTIEKAKALREQIKSGFGIQFQSKKYRNQAAQQITQKLAEADRMIAEMQKSRDQYSTARMIDAELNANFATGVYMDKAFLKQYSQFKRRNGMLGGQFTGRDILPSYLAEGEMVLNPYQIASVIQNAGGEDVFKGAGIPGYSTGTFVGGNNQQSVTPSSSSPQSSGEKQPLIVKIYQTNSGLVQSDILDTVIEGFQDDYEVQTELVKAYDKTKSRNG